MFYKRCRSFLIGTEIFLGVIWIFGWLALSREDISLPLFLLLNVAIVLLLCLEVVLLHFFKSQVIRITFFDNRVVFETNGGSTIFYALIDVIGITDLGGYYLFLFADQKKLCCQKFYNLRKTPIMDFSIIDNLHFPFAQIH